MFIDNQTTQCSRCLEHTNRTEIPAFTELTSPVQEETTAINIINYTVCWRVVCTYRKMEGGERDSSTYGGGGQFSGGSGRPPPQGSRRAKTWRRGRRCQVGS